MKFYTFAVLLLGLLTACTGAKTATNSGSDSLKKTETYRISGKVEQQFPYCGGAVPTQEMRTKAATPVAYPNKTFYVRAGRTNRENGEVIKRFTTDNEGLYSIALLPGIYSIIVEEQLNAVNPKDYTTENQKVNESCLADWWKKPYYLLEVKDQNITSLNFTFVHRCFLTNDIPCITYTGPMPH